MQKRGKETFKIYLFRHGQTYFNRAHIFTGWKDSKLTPLGIKQAKKVARELKNKHIKVAFCSTLSRSIDTLKYVIKLHPECHIIIEDKRLMERSYGDLEGTSHHVFIHKKGTDDYKTLLHWHKISMLTGKEREEFEERMGEAELRIVRRAYYSRAPHGESVQDVEKRVKPFIKDLLAFIKRNRVNVAISASGNSMRPIRRFFEHASIDEMMSWEMPFDDYFEYEVRV